MPIRLNRKCQIKRCIKKGAVGSLNVPTAPFFVQEKLNLVLCEGFILFLFKKNLF